MGHRGTARAGGVVSQAKQIERVEALRPFKPYPVYKDSGVEWLGEIPAHWQVRSLKRVTSIRYGLGEPPQLLADGLPFVRATNVTKGRIVDRDMQFVDPKDVPWSRDPALRTGDIIVVRSGAYTGDSAIIPKSHDGAIAGYDMVVRVRQGQPQFLAWALLSRYVLEAQIELESMRAAQPHLNAEELGAVAILLPPDSEQRAIAAFLDRETARIDALVAKKEQLIELLQERRTALMTRAVTKGLDPNVPMKDSGVEWPGQIPTHWEVKRIKWAARMVSGHTPDKKVESYWQGGDIPWVSLADTGQLREVDYISTTAVMTTADGIAHSSAHVLPSSTVVFSRDASIGLCAITRSGMAVSQHFIGWVCGSHLLPEYLLFVLRAMTQELERLTMGATVRTIGMPDVQRLTTPIPPLSEQEDIVAHVRERRGQIDSLTAKVREAIDRLKELRTALISAAVTGKIDVREEIA